MTKYNAWKSLPAGTTIVVFAIGVLAVTNNALANPVVPNAVIEDFRHGTYPSLGDRTHVGVDLFALCGMPVYAIEDGTVIDTIASKDDRNFESLGYMVLIEPA